jgi:hypothetical protein
MSNADSQDLKRKQEAERLMREKRDRETQQRTPGPGEPHYRNGADRRELGQEGWSEVEDGETPPRGGHSEKPVGDTDKPSGR